MREQPGRLTVARLAIDHLNLARPAEAGVHVYDVCDADSSGWEAVYTYLLQRGQYGDELKAEFGLNEPVFDVLFLYRSVFHPAIAPWRPIILHHASCLFGEESAMVMWENETDLPKSELARLGFRRIAGTELLFKPNMLIDDYSA